MDNKNLGIVFKIFILLCILCAYIVLIRLYIPQRPVQLLLLFLGLGVIMIRVMYFLELHKKNLRQSRNLCIYCGYDMMDFTKCPECGKRRR